MKRFFKESAWKDDDITTIEFDTKSLKSSKRKKKKHETESKNYVSKQVEKEDQVIVEGNSTCQQQSPSATSKQKPSKNHIQKSAKKNKTKNNAITKIKNNLPPIQPENTNNFSEKLRENLKGGRFRYINEQLYTIKGSEAKHLFDNDKESFTSYHDGYRNQVDKWPINPLNRIINKIKKLPKHLVIADFGCGEGKLADSIKNQIYSIDLVSTKPGIIACDMAHTPIAADNIDVAVYCLSLMGTNLNEFVLEANRVLKTDGILLIVEIASRFENFMRFIKLIEKFGFKLIRRDQDEQKFFHFFDFQKISNTDKPTLKKIELQLKPCIYKKR